MVSLESHYLSGPSPLPVLLLHVRDHLLELELLQRLVELDGREAFGQHQLLRLSVDGERELFVGDGHELAVVVLRETDVQ